VIPQCIDLPPQEQWWQERVLRKVDWLTPPARRNLYRAQQMGLDINRILFSHRKVQQANHDTQDASIGLTQAFQALDVANDLKTERLSKFTEALKAIKSDLHELANATDHAARDIARSRFGQDTLELNKAFHHELVEFELRGKVMLREPLKALKLIKKHGWEIFDEDILRNVERAARALRFVGNMVLVADGTEGAWETIEAYREGKDWIKVAAKESGDMASLVIVRSTIVGGLTLLGITPVGWVAFLAIGTATSIGSFYLDKDKLNPLIEEYF
jgi:hypothetical protein